MPSNAPVIIASLAALACIGSASDASAMDQGFYVGGYYGSLSRSNSKNKDIDRIASNSVDLYAQIGYEALDLDPRLHAKDQSFGFFGGFRWTPNLAFEVGYIDLGQITYRSDDVVVDHLDTTPTVVDVSTRWRAESSAFTLSALGIWPLTYEWELFARGGFALSSTKARIRIDDPRFREQRFGDNDDKANLLAGAGISYTFLDVYSLRAEWQRVFDAGSNSLGSKSDVDLLSIGIMVSF